MLYYLFFSLICLCFEGAARPSTKLSRYLNHVRCESSELTWDVLDPKAAAPLFRDCGIVFWDQRTLDPTGDLLTKLNRTAHRLLKHSDSKLIVRPGLNREDRYSLIPPYEEPFGRDFLEVIVNSAIFELLRLHLNNTDPALSYIEVWAALHGAPAQEIHTDDEGGSFLMFWTLDDLGDEPRGQNGEYMAIPGCFNPPDGVSEWCERIEDKQSDQVDYEKYDMRRVIQNSKAGSGFLYNTNLLHAGLPNFSRKPKLAITLSFHGRSKQDLKTSRNERSNVKESYGTKIALQTAAKAQRHWNSLIGQRQSTGEL